MISTVDRKLIQVVMHINVSMFKIYNDGKVYFHRIVPKYISLEISPKFLNSLEWVVYGMDITVLTCMQVNYVLKGALFVSRQLKTSFTTKLERQITLLRTEIAIIKLFSRWGPEHCHWEACSCWRLVQLYLPPRQNKIIFIKLKIIK